MTKYIRLLADSFTGGIRREVRKVKFLVVEDQDEIREIILMVIDNLDPKAIVHESPTVKGAKEFIDSNTEYDLVICDYNLLDGVGGEVYSYLRDSRNKKTPFLFQTSRALDEIMNKSDFYKLDSYNDYLQKPYLPSKLELAIENATSHKMRKDLNRSWSDYYRIRPHFYLRYDYTTVDTYISLSEDKYVKLFHGHHQFTVKDIAKLIDKGVTHFFVRKEDLSNSLLSIRSLSFLAKKQMVEKNMQARWEEHFEVIRGVLADYGISDYVVDRCRDVVAMTHKYLGEKDESIKKLMEGQFYRGNYLSDHSLMVAIISTSLIAELGWSVQNGEEKYVLASLFHDITLTHETAQCELDNDLGLTTQNETRYKEHPVTVVKLLKKLLGFSTDVERIILEHHERPDGNGFPKGLRANQINPLSMVFIVAHDFIKEVYQTGFDHSAKQLVIDDLEKKFSSGTFELIMRALSRIILKEREREIAA